MKKSKSPKGIEPMTSRTQCGRLIHWAKKTHRERSHLTEFKYDTLLHTARNSIIQSRGGKFNILLSLSHASDMLIISSLSQQSTCFKVCSTPDLEDFHETL